MSKSVNKRMRIQRRVDSKRDVGMGEFRYKNMRISIHSYNEQYILHINLGRYTRQLKGCKHTGITTHTLYDSFEVGDKPYTSVWLDKQGRKVVGLEVSWKD